MTAPVLSKARILDRVESVDYRKDRLRGEEAQTLAQWYLALDAAARKAFDALAEIVALQAERPDEDLGCTNCDRWVDAYGIARAALPEGWEEK
jgi:hypothetical protein